MSLADRLKEDVTHIFFRESEFARRHSFNGTEILCIVDGEDWQKNKNMNGRASYHPSRSGRTARRYAA